MAHTHKHEKKVWQPSPYVLEQIEHSTMSLRSSDDEFEKAFKILKKYPRRVTFFGSARLQPEDPYYQKAYDLARMLSRDNFAIMTGGGGGIMEAGNRGAHDVKGNAIGFNIILPHEQRLNPFTTDNLSFHYFFTRKVMMTFYAHAYVFFPGGYGTLDEFFEVITLVQTKKMAKAPLILVGHDFWHGIDDFVKKHQLKTGLISPGDEELYTITDDLQKVREIINSDYDT
jgi:uncharacterized protein (TIGR00730 family)